VNAADWKFFQEKVLSDPCKIIPRACVDLGNVSSEKKDQREGGRNVWRELEPPPSAELFHPHCRTALPWKCTLFSSLNALYLAARCLVRAAVAGSKTKSSAVDLAKMRVPGGDASAASVPFPQGHRNATFTRRETLA